MPRKKSSNGHPTSINPPKYFLEIAELVSERYPDAKKIIEIGVGKAPYAALHLKSFLPEAEITVTDVDEQVVREVARRGLNAVADDISNPDLGIYKGVDLIYSIRPPFELIPKIALLAEKVGSDALIIPLSEDAYLSSLSREWHPIRKGSFTAYLLRKKAPGPSEVV